MYYENRHNRELIQILLVYSTAFCLLDHKSATHWLLFYNLLFLKYYQNPPFLQKHSQN